MKVLIKNQLSDLPVTSVVITRDPSDPQGLLLHAFHCSQCGQVVGQYIGTIYMLVPGGIPVELPYISLCSRCGWRYAIHAIV